MKILRNQPGVTLLEMVMAGAVMGILAVVMTNFFANSLVTTAINDSEIELQNNTKGAVETILRDVRFAQYVRSTSTNSQLDLAIPAQDGPNGKIIYSDLLHNNPKLDTISYYATFSGSTTAVFKQVDALAAPNNCDFANVLSCDYLTDTTTKLIKDGGAMAFIYFDKNGAPSLTPADAWEVAVLVSQGRIKYNRSITATFSGRARLRNQ